VSWCTRSRRTDPRLRDLVGRAEDADLKLPEMIQVLRDRAEAMQSVYDE
jgi:hypothetical protein